MKRFSQISGFTYSKRPRGSTSPSKVLSNFPFYQKTCSVYILVTSIYLRYKPHWPQIQIYGDTIFSKRCGDSLGSYLMLLSQTRATDTSSMEITASLVWMWLFILPFKDQNFSLSLGISLTRGTPGLFRSSPRCSEMFTSLTCSPSEEEVGKSNISWRLMLFCFS